MPAPLNMHLQQYRGGRTVTIPEQQDMQPCTKPTDQNTMLTKHYKLARTHKLPRKTGKNNNLYIHTRRPRAKKHILRKGGETQHRPFHTTMTTTTLDACYTYIYLYLYIYMLCQQRLFISALTLNYYCKRLFHHARATKI